MTTPAHDPSGTKPMHYTWTCLDCNAWADQHWPSPQAAAAASDAARPGHRKECPGQARLCVIGNPDPGHPEQRSVAELMGTYDPNEPLLVPTWAVHIASALAVKMANCVADGTTTDLSDPKWINLVDLVGGLYLVDPQPGRPKPTTQDELAGRLRELHEALRATLPDPFPKPPIQPPAI